MALINCPECGKEVSSEAKVCPNCGYIKKSPKKKWYEKWWIWTIIGVMIAAVLVGYFIYEYNLGREEAKYTEDYKRVQDLNEKIQSESDILNKYN